MNKRSGFPTIKCNSILLLDYNIGLMIIFTFADCLEGVEHFFDFSYWEKTKTTRFYELALDRFTNIVNQRNTWPYEQMRRDFYGEAGNKILSTVNSESIK
jgi:hypothetical protein